MWTREDLIRLNQVSGLGAASVHRLMEIFSGAGDFFQAGPADWKKALGRVGVDETLQAVAKEGRGSTVPEEIERAARAGVQIVTILDADYPQLLKAISDPPPVLYYKGSLLEEDRAAVAMVGTRNATPYGLAVARQLGRDLAQAGISVISGLAEGIDGAAHEGALEAGGRTLAVMGHGLSHLYPPSHRKLAERVCASGALISEFPMEMPGERMNFPRRNRLIAGLSLGTVVVEAPVTSGALITARHAMEQDREVFAVPGPISSVRSRGAHRLIQDGAKLIENVADILEELLPHLKSHLADWKSDAIAAGVPLGVKLSSEEQAVYEAIPAAGSAVVDALVQTTTLPPQKLLGALTGLELKGLIRQVPGQGYGRLS